MTTLSAGQMLDLLSAGGVPDSELATWLARAKAESSLRTDVVNSIGAVGLFQINQPVWVKQYPTWSIAWLQNPTNNVAAARVVSNDWKNSSPWISSQIGTVALIPISQLQVTQWIRTRQAQVIGGSVAGGIIGGFVGGPVAAGTGQILGSSAPYTVPAAEAALRPFSSILDFLNTLAQTGTWVRVGKVVVGVGLVWIGAQAIMRPIAEPVAGTAAKVAKVAAL